MRSKKILLICTISLVTVSAMLVSCGQKENIKNSNDKKIESISEESDKDKERNDTEENKENGEELNGGENKVINNNENKVLSEEVNKEVAKVDFSKYSDKFLIDFLNEGTTALIKELNTTSIMPYVYNVRKASYTELVEPIETIEKRQAIIGRYYAPDVYKEEYVTKDGTTYLKNPYYRHYVNYNFKSVKSREIIDNNRLRVTFNVGMYYQGTIDKKYKTVEFSEIDGKLKAVTLFQDRSMFNILENGDKNYNIDPALDNQEIELFDYVDKALEGVMNPEFIVNGIDHRSYDPKTDSKYYAISVLEPEVCSAPYHVNIKNGAIYGSREGRFVVEPKK